MRTNRVNHLSISLCKDAVRACFKNKWRRRDVLCFVEKYSGVPREYLAVEEFTVEKIYREEAIEACAYALYETVDEILNGYTPDDVDDVEVRQRVDGISGKTRDIAMLCIMHQLIGHLAERMLEPLFKARLLPTQHASIPRRGQTRLKDQLRRYFLKKSVNVRYFQKTDIVHAYGTTTYDLCINFIKKDLPKETDLHRILEFLGSLAPDGHLIIGGFLDAWLFNYIASFAIRYAYTLGTRRRGKFQRYIVRCCSFMDDFVFLTRSIKALKIVISKLSKWVSVNLKLSLRVTTGIIKLLSAKEECMRRFKQGKSAKGCPVLDMAGYKICRTHTAIRRRIFLRLRREFEKAYKEYVSIGTIRHFRALRIISYHGYVVQSNSYNLNIKYHIDKIVNIARRVCGFYSALNYRKRKGKSYEKFKYYRKHNAAACTT